MVRKRGTPLVGPFIEVRVYDLSSQNPPKMSYTYVSAQRSPIFCRRNALLSTKHTSEYETQSFKGKTFFQV